MSALVLGKFDGNLAAIGDLLGDEGFDEIYYLAPDRATAPAEILRRCRPDVLLIFRGDRDSESVRSLCRHATKRMIPVCIW